jgi:adenosyl cobinamide kinase/adenosyl cobinamide phosphate guanylyltransferase
MDLIIGGAYQGKRAYAIEQYLLNDEDIFTCTGSGGIGFGARCIDRIEEFTLWCVKHHVDAVELFRDRRDEWEDCVLICRDIFCGVVPMGEEMRAWRETTGRLCAYLATEAGSVVRIYCGLEQRLK